MSGPQSRSGLVWREEYIFSPKVFEPPAVQPVASRCTDWPIPNPWINYQVCCRMSRKALSYSRLTQAYVLCHEVGILGRWVGKQNNRPIVLILKRRGWRRSHYTRIKDDDKGRRRLGSQQAARSEEEMTTGWEACASRRFVYWSSQMLEEDRVEAAKGIRDGKDARIGLQYRQR